MKTEVEVCDICKRSIHKSKIEIPSRDEWGKFEVIGDINSTWYVDEMAICQDCQVILIKAAKLGLIVSGSLKLGK